MGLFSIVGRACFSFYFIYSCWISLKELNTDARLREEYISKMVGFLSFLADLPEETKVRTVCILVSFCDGLKANGGVVFLFGRLYGVCHLILYLVIATPIQYDFYRYKVEDPEFLVLLQGFVQNVAFFGALLFFVEMKNMIGRRQPKEKSPKSRTTQDRSKDD